MTKILDSSVEEIYGALGEQLDAQLLELITSYLQQIRCPLLGGNIDGMLIVGAGRGCIGIDALRQRMRKLRDSIGSSMVSTE
jgi:hypothetical protein